MSDQISVEIEIICRSCGVKSLYLAWPDIAQKFNNTHKCKIIDGVGNGFNLRIIYKQPKE